MLIMFLFCSVEHPAEFYEGDKDNDRSAPPMDTA